MIVLPIDAKCLENGIVLKNAILFCEYCMYLYITSGCNANAEEKCIVIIIKNATIDFGKCI